VNDARNVRRVPKTSYATIRSWHIVSTTTRRCPIPPTRRGRRSRLTRRAPRTEHLFLERDPGGLESLGDRGTAATGSSRCSRCEFRA